MPGKRSFEGGELGKGQGDEKFLRNRMGNATDVAQEAEKKRAIFSQKELQEHAETFIKLDTNWRPLYTTGYPPPEPVAEYHNPATVLEVIGRRTERSGTPRYTLNSELIDLEEYPGVPVVANHPEFKGQFASEVVPRIFRTVNDRFYLPDLGYQFWLAEDASRVPELLKNITWGAFSFGSFIQNPDGTWSTTFGFFDKNSQTWQVRDGVPLTGDRRWGDWQVLLFPKD